MLSVEAELSVFQAAMFYADWIPSPAYDLQGRAFCEKHLKSLYDRKGWDVYQTLLKQVANGEIKAIRMAHEDDGSIDPLRTIISRSALLDLAVSRGDPGRILALFLSPENQDAEASEEYSEDALYAWYLSMRVIKGKPAFKREEDEDAAGKKWKNVPTTKLREDVRTVRGKFTGKRGGRPTKEEQKQKEEHNLAK